MNKVKAIALCRVSTKGQMKDGNLEPQEERILKAAEILDCEIVKWWKLAVSSRKGKNTKRKDILEMYEYCKRYKSVKLLIVDEVDRFMRSIDEYYFWKVQFKNINVQLRHANRPEVDPDEDRAIFDELIDVYRAEQSNNERIKKTPEKMMAKIRAGYYPSNPKTGYKTSDTPGLHEPHEPTFSAMQKAFKQMAAGQLTVKEGLELATELGLRTANYGPKAVGGRPVDMYRWKDLMRDPYYCGVVKMADWPEVNDDGLHNRMITPEEHKILVAMADNKGKAFIVKRNNPEFPLSNQVECEPCLSKGVRNPRIVGYVHNNGKPGNSRKYYKRYRCRQCNKNVRLENLHDDINEVLEGLQISYEQTAKLKVHLKKAWKSYEMERYERLRIAQGRVHNLKESLSAQVKSLAINPELKDVIKHEIENLRHKIDEAEIVEENTKDFERDFVEFTEFALSFISSLRDHWWTLEKEKMERCKQILFPAGIQIIADKKVYTPEISLVYRYEEIKTAPEDAEISRLEGPVGLEPTTPCLKGRCSNRLSYGPAF